MKNWYFSLLMLAVYVATFLIWKAIPTRSGYLCGGLAAITLLSGAMFDAARRNYFCGRVDFLVHLYVIVDLVLETVAYEAFRLGIDFLDRGAGEAVVADFHANNNFYGCAAIFTILIGANRWLALRRKRPPPRAGAEPARENPAASSRAFSPGRGETR